MRRQTSCFLVSNAWPSVQNHTTLSGLACVIWSLIRYDGYRVTIYVRANPSTEDNFILWSDTRSFVSAGGGRDSRLDLESVGPIRNVWQLGTSAHAGFVGRRPVLAPRHVPATAKKKEEPYVKIVIHIKMAGSNMRHHSPFDIYLCPFVWMVERMILLLSLLRLHEWSQKVRRTQWIFYEGIS
jgi:hypothetical protein